VTVHATGTAIHMATIPPRTDEFCAVILAGGRGTRFWPLSRRHSAKQVLNIVGEGTMLQQTLKRLKPLAAPRNTWIITSRELRQTVLKQAPEVPPAQVIAEPVGRNTAPAIGLGAELILRSRGDSIMGVFPADHLISEPANFVKVIQRAIGEARRPGRLIVIGVTPTHPETGYGYIEVIEEPQRKRSEAALRVRRFTEKPDARTAREFVEAGNYYWNSGMFVWRASSILEALAEYLPMTSERLRRITEAPKSKFTLAMERIYPESDNISIDYAVLEKARNLSCVPAPELKWNDLGSWSAVYNELASENSGTVVRSGEVVEIGSAGNLIAVEGKTVGLVGVHDLIVVETRDALLVVPRAEAQRVSELVKELERRGKDRVL
jgi:mannose-1-phosphate guanylyltransferase